ncbi:MutS family protein [Saccharomycopsis crataegensis]|uniref:MutS family protein n=1 Tax=Saccharomycopsis crataegensis TaxID=43959 RepID=A0AAV5QUX2_9ASCO|nr:MutS family protein [Saccharomycopsis crataegensis]
MLTSNSSRFTSAIPTRSGTIASQAPHNAVKVLCSITESQALAPIVGIAFLFLATGELIVSCIKDSQTYIRTIHKIQVYSPTEIMIPTGLAQSNLMAILESNLSAEVKITLISKNQFTCDNPMSLIQKYTFSDDFIKLRLELVNQVYGLNSIVAIVKYIETAPNYSSQRFRKLRVKYEACENTMFIDSSTTKALELIDSNTEDGHGMTLFKMLNCTVTKMGERVLRNNILQPLTDKKSLILRLESVKELLDHEDARISLIGMLEKVQDIDKLLVSLIRNSEDVDQKINNILLLKQAIHVSVEIGRVLKEHEFDSVLLKEIQKLCTSYDITNVLALINEYINEDCVWTSKPLELKSQKCYAVKANKNGLLDVSRQLYTKIIERITSIVEQLAETHGLVLDYGFESSKGMVVKINKKLNDIDFDNLPSMFINKSAKRSIIQCTTLDILKLNRRLQETLNEIFLLCDKTIDELNEMIEDFTSGIFMMAEALAILDLLCGFSQLASKNPGYACPEYADKLVIKQGRHPILETIISANSDQRFVANDMFAINETSRVTMITGDNMSGKSVYLKQVALINIMGQLGCYVPADYALLPIYSKIMARVRNDALEVNVSSFSLEMSEMAFILAEVERRPDEKGLILIDELGRGTSLNDGIAITAAVASHLADNFPNSHVFAATHFREAASAIAEKLSVRQVHMGNEQRRFKVIDGGADGAGRGIALVEKLGLFPANILQNASKIANKLAIKDQTRFGTEVRVEFKKRIMVDLMVSLKELQRRMDDLDHQEVISSLASLQRKFVDKMAS